MRNELKNKCGQKIIEASKLRTIEKISFLKPQNQQQNTFALAGVTHLVEQCPMN